MVVEYPVQLVTGERLFWPKPNSDTFHEFLGNDCSLNYKYQGVFPEEMKERLQRAAEAAYLLDEEMSSIREEIQEAQHYFSHGRGLLENEYYKQIKTKHQKISKGLLMKVAIVHNSEEKSKQVTKQLTTLLEQNQIQIDNRQPELVISVGGDGTLLSAFHRFNHLLNEVS